MKPGIRYLVFSASMLFVLSVHVSPAEAEGFRELEGDGTIDDRIVSPLGTCNTGAGPFDCDEGYRQGLVGGDQLLGTLIGADVLDPETETILWSGHGPVVVTDPEGTVLTGTELTSCAVTTGDPECFRYDPVVAGAHMVRPLLHQFMPDDPTADDNAGGPNANQITAYYPWDLRVQNGDDEEQLGRIWSTFWTMNANEFDEDAAANNRFYAIVPSGTAEDQAVIELVFDGIAGFKYQIFANSVGPRGANGFSGGRSVLGQGVSTRELEFRLYLNPPPLETASYTFEPPIAENFDFLGGTEDSPCDGVLSLESGGQGGTFTFDTNVDGTFQIICDLNGNGGSIVDPEDLVLIGNTSPGFNEVDWNGIDSNGEPIGFEDDQPFTEYSCLLRVTVGEFHYVGVDIETVFPGLRLFHLDTPSATPDPLDMYWNDRAVFDNAVSLPADFGDCGVAPETSLADGLPSGNQAESTAPWTATCDDGNARAWGEFEGGVGRGESAKLDTFTWIDDDTDGPIIIRVYNPDFDTDGEGVPDFWEDCFFGTDFEDCDSDNDGVTDFVETEENGAARDTDGDGMIDALDPDDDNDGIATSDEVDVEVEDPDVCPAEEPTINNDDDNLPDYRDPDDDNDGIPTIDELDEDTDDDDLVNYIDPDDDGDGVMTIDELDEDTDDDGTDNYLDDDDDGDNVPTEDELDEDTDDDGTDNYLDDDDDGDNVPTIDEDHESEGDPQGTDTDDDETPDYLDADDDGDNVPTIDEDPESPGDPQGSDTDDDGTPDYLDTDDDDDGKPSITEDGDSPGDPQGTDVDGDNIPDFLDSDEEDGPLGDPDMDGILNEDDNCDYDHNIDQADFDDDGEGDACESDIDGDGILNEDDNCVFDQNTDQSDVDDDGDGDVCDDDADDDGILNPSDNCVLVVNPGQEDLNSDGEGDACDDDIDGDSFVNDSDNCPFLANPDQRDDNSDGIGDLCQDDGDGDGVIDLLDNCVGVVNTQQLDTDNDGMGDSCDDDMDGDGLSNDDETNIHMTDPRNADTDGGGITDGVEIDDGMDPLDYYDDLGPFDASGGNLFGADCSTTGHIAPNGLSLGLLALFGALIGVRRRRSGQRR